MCIRDRGPNRVTRASAATLRSPSPPRMTTSRSPWMPTKASSAARRATRRAADDALVGIHGDRLVVILGGEGDLRVAAEALVTRFGPGPVSYTHLTLPTILRV